MQKMRTAACFLAWAILWSTGIYLAQHSRHLGAAASVIAPLAPPPGKLQILVVPAMWADYTGEVPVSQARLAELMNIVRTYYLEASYGKLDMVPTVTPWIRLAVPRPPSGCPNV